MDIDSRPGVFRLQHHWLIDRLLNWVANHSWRLAMHHKSRWMARLILSYFATTYCCLHLIDRRDIASLLTVISVAWYVLNIFVDRGNMRFTATSALALHDLLTQVGRCAAVGYLGDLDISLRHHSFWQIQLTLRLRYLLLMIKTRVR